MYSGWLIIDKPVGISSAKVVSKIKKILCQKKVGHGGTLDPLASGVLPIAINQATRTSQYILNKDKEYEFTIKLGQQTDTDDIEGKIINQSDIKITLNDITELLNNFIGKIEQIPPQFSAIKVDGKRSYKLAREGKVVNLKSRLVNIFDLKILNFDENNQLLHLYVKCSKGTYVRSIARDIGIKLGCLGYITNLRRKKVGNFSEDLAISLDKLEKIVHNNQVVENYLQPIDMVLDDIPAFEINDKFANDLKNGKFIELFLSPNNFQQNKAIRAMYKNKLVAIGFFESGFFKPKKVFNY